MNEVQQAVSIKCCARTLIGILVILHLGQSLQLNDEVDLSNQQQISNVTRLKEQQQLEVINSSDNAIRRMRNVNRQSTHNKRRNVFSQWSSWSDCDKFCRQKRSRHCTERKKCGTIKQLEQRSCPDYICNSSESSTKPVYILTGSKKQYDSSEDEEIVLKATRLRNKSNSRRKKKIVLELSDDDDDNDFFNKRRRSIKDDSRLVMKVVKQGDYRQKKSGDLERDFFLPRNMTAFNVPSVAGGKKNHRKRDSELESPDFESYDDEEEEDYDANEDEEEDDKQQQLTKSGRTKAVFELPRKPLANYSKWSRWSKCTPKCITRRYKKCRPHARNVCGNDIIREIAYCYTEGSFCEGWISSQLSKINDNTIETPKTTTTRKPARASRRTESPLLNSVSQNFYGSSNNQQVATSKRKPKSPAGSKIQNFQCGFPSIRSKHSDFVLKIIGGKISRRGQWPWQVAILNRYKEAFCGGTLITESWVLTASHCVRKLLYVVLGEHNLKTKEGNEIELKIKRFIKHPKYNKKTVDNDIALLRLPEAVERSHYIGFACLPEKNQPLPVGNTCTVIGWGKKRRNDESGTNVLHEAEVSITSIESCKNSYSDYVITKNMFCAGAQRVDTCAGDSGGPLLCRDANKLNKPWTVYGITSFGEGCAKRPGIYTKITNYVDFIWSAINCNGKCENSTI